MLVRLTKDSFVRNYKENGYITNQLTNNDRLFNETGADFLSMLTRFPQEIDEIILKLANLYQDVNIDQLKDDFIDFLKALEADGFVLLGNDEKELNEKEPSFAYNTNDVKTAKSFFSDDFRSDGTSEYIYENLLDEYQLLNINIELTKRCNERCIHCYLPNYQKEKGHSMSLRDAKEYLNQALDMGVLSVSFTGGEPFLNKNIDEILLYAREKDLMIGILSNLTLITEERIPVLKKINPSIIQVSLYSMNAEVHDKITLFPGSHKKTIKTIELLLANDIPVKISCPVMKINYNDYKDVLVWANQHKISASTDFELSGQTDFNTENLQYAPSYEQSKQVLSDILEEDKEWQRVILTEYAKGITYKDDGNRAVCGAGNDTLYISSNGEVFPCGSWQSYKLGDLKKETLYNIWNKNEKIDKLRAIRLKHFPEYMNSKQKEFTSVCMARNANANNGDFMKMDLKKLEVGRMTKELVDDFILRNKK
jgi:radical SAM protein with 4Fe4S-binding SPASM domain